MRCLMCGCEKDEASLVDLLDGSDPLCNTCRTQWQKKNVHFKIAGIPAYAPYIYNDAFAQCLIQFKECGDEALKDVFLQGLVHQIRTKYLGYTLVLAPSSQEKLRSRGFSHLAEMYSCLHMPMLEPFEKKTDISQKKKGFQARMNMRNAIVLKDEVTLPKKILLVDDTVTTGATLLGCLGCLKDPSSKIRVFAVSANEKWLKKRFLSDLV